MSKTKIYTWGNSQEFVRVDKSIYMQFLRDYRAQKSIEQNAFMDWVDTYDFSLVDADIDFQSKLQPCMIARKYVGCEKHEFYILKSFRHKYKKQKIESDKEHPVLIEEGKPTSIFGLIDEYIGKMCKEVLESPFFAPMLALHMNNEIAKIKDKETIVKEASINTQSSCKENLDNLVSKNTRTNLGDTIK